VLEVWAPLRKKLGTLGCEASPNLYGCRLKEEIGELGVCNVKPSANLVEANFTSERRGLL